MITQARKGIVTSGDSADVNSSMSRKQLRARLAAAPYLCLPGRACAERLNSSVTVWMYWRKGSSYTLTWETNNRGDLEVRFGTFGRFRMDLATTGYDRIA